MTDGDFDPALFGVWPTRRAYAGALGRHDGIWDDGILDDGLRDEALQDEALRLILDRKAADVPAGDDLVDMLNGMTRELREQMQTFQMLRRQSECRAREPGEEIDRKMAQADAKASIEAMSLIVRTLEKIDSLQRTLAQDRERREEETLDDADYRTLLGRIEALIEQRAAERAVTGAASGQSGRLPAGGTGDPGG